MGERGHRRHVGLVLASIALGWGCGSGAEAEPAQPMGVAAHALGDGRDPPAGLAGPTLGPQVDLGPPIPSEPHGSEQNVIVASNGTDYLVAWQAGAVFFARVAADGTLLNQAAVPVVDSRVDAASGSKCFSAASDGTDYLLAWCDSRLGQQGDTQIRAARVDAAGTVLDESSLSVSHPAGCDSGACRADAVSVASDGKNYLLVWADALTGTLRSVQMGSTGKLAQATVLFAGKAGNIAYGDGEYLLASEHDNGPAVRATLLTIGGVAQSASFTLSATGAEPCAASDGSEFFVAWNESSALKGTRVSAGGTVLDPAGLSLANGVVGAQGWAPKTRLVFDGTDYVFAWANPVNATTAKIFAGRVNPAGSATQLASDASAKESPALASMGAGALAVWSTGGPRARFARLDASGAPLDDPAALLPESPRLSKKAAAAVASNGVDYLVVWEDDRSAPASGGIFGARVNGAGVVLDGADIAISPASGLAREPAVASDGSDYLVVWAEGAGQDAAIRGARLSGAGAVLDAASLELGPGDSPVVASDGSDYLVLAAGNGLEASLVAADGTVSALGSMLSAVPESYRAASNGNDYLLAWSAGSEGILMTRISAAGAALDSPPIVASSVGANVLDVVSDGSDYFVAWSLTESDPALDTLHATRITASGAALEASLSIDVGPPPVGPTRPVLAFNGLGYLLATTAGEGVLLADLTTTGALEGALTSLDPIAWRQSVASNRSSYLVAYQRRGDPRLFATVVDAGIGVGGGSGGQAGASGSGGSAGAGASATGGQASNPGPMELSAHGGCSVSRTRGGAPVPWLAAVLGLGWRRRARRSRRTPLS